MRSVQSATELKVDRTKIRFDSRDSGRSRIARKSRNIIRSRGTSKSVGRGDWLDAKTHARPDGARSTQDGEIGTDDAPQGGDLDRAIAPGTDPDQPRRDAESAAGDPSSGASRSTGVDRGRCAQPAMAESRENAAPAPPEEPAAPESPVVAEKAEPQPPPPPRRRPDQEGDRIAGRRDGERDQSRPRSRSAQPARWKQGYRSAVAESDRWKRREMLVRQQIAGITAEAEKLEREADELDAERDVLERERDATKAALAKASTRSGFAVLPYKGPNGTWRRPIVVECTGGGAKLQPRGPSFTALELSPRIHPRSSDFVKAIARELFHIRSADTPDGTPAVPYIVFLVRPDGIAPTTSPVPASSRWESHSATS